MSYKKHFQKILTKHFPQKGNVLRSRIDIAFADIQKDIGFSINPKNPMDKRMQIAGYFLATIKVLDNEQIDFEGIRNIVIEIAHEYVRPKNKIQAFLKQLPVKMMGTVFSDVLLNYLKKKVAIKGHPDGFVVNMLTDKAETLGFGYGFDIIECGICKLFAKHHYQKYTPILCEVDHITSHLAGLTLVRTGTIANGATTCDFRFKKQ
jgi:L-2-amino-thiazoline-4-carboxylic acid hydrolase